MSEPKPEAEKPTIPVAPELTWDHVYLLGWYDHTGRSYLSTWSGNLPMVHVVVQGVTPLNMPLWSAPIPENAQLLPIPPGQNPNDYAREVGGFHAFGWYLEEPFERKAP